MAAGVDAGPIGGGGSCAALPRRSDALTHGMQRIRHTRCRRTSNKSLAIGEPVSDRIASLSTKR